MSKKKKVFLEKTNQFLPKTIGRVSYIYFIICEVDKKKHWQNKVKIGFSSHPRKRLSELQTGNPFKLKMWYFFPVDYEDASYLENQLHKKFFHSNHNHEWFQIRPCIREWIKNHKECIKFYELKKSRTNVLLRKNA